MTRMMRIMGRVPTLKKKAIKSTYLRLSLWFFLGLGSQSGSGSVSRCFLVQRSAARRRKAITDAPMIDYHTFDRSNNFLFLSFVRQKEGEARSDG